jgi:hypothetical protein
MWCQVLDRLCDILEDNPTVWLRDISGERKKARRRGKGSVEYHLKLRCYSAGTDPNNQARFREDLRSTFVTPGVFDKLLPEYVDYSKIEWKGYDPDVSLTFDLELVRRIKPRAETKAGRGGRR